MPVGRLFDCLLTQKAVWSADELSLNEPSPSLVAQIPGTDSVYRLFGVLSSLDQ